MAIAIVICIAAFIWLYVQVGPLLSDFVALDSSTGEEDPAETGLIGEFPESTPTPVGLLIEDLTDDDPDQETDDAPIPTPVVNDDEPDIDEPEEPERDELWEPTHAVREGPNVNFRSGPNTISQTQGALSPGTELRFLDDEEPAGGVVWMYFDIEDGTEGWIRDIDVIELDEGADDDDLDDDSE